MKTLNLLTIVAGVAIAAAGCKGKSSETRAPAATGAPSVLAKEVRDPPLVLQSYAVPKDQGGQVRQILSSVFHGVKEKVAARAALGPDGQLVVVAPESIQVGVKKLIEKMATTKVPQSPTVELTYWLVVGRPAQKASIPSELQGAKEALDTVVQSQGAMEFALLERLRLRSLADQQGSTQGNHGRIRQLVSLVGGKIVGDISVEVLSNKARSRLETRVALDESKQLILGEAGFQAPADLLPLRQGGEAKAATLFYVIQTRVAR